MIGDASTTEDEETGVNIGQIAKMAQQMQTQMAQAQEELKQTTLEATAGGGAVRVVITGRPGGPERRDRSVGDRSRRRSRCSRTS